MEKSITTYLLIFSFFFLSSCKEAEKKTKKNISSVAIDGYTITGKTTSTKPNYIYILNEQNQRIDSVKIENQNFSLKGKINTPNLYYLQLQNTDYKYPIILENTKYHALLNKKKAMIIGGNLNAKLTHYQDENNLNYKEKSDFHNQYITKDITLKAYLKAVDSLREIEKKEFNNFIIANEGNILSSIALKQRKLSSKDVIELKKQITTANNTDLLNKLNSLAENLKIEEAEKKILRRRNAPLFSGVNLSGSKSSLKSLMRGKKAFLIDFWASWCPPCRESSPKIIRLYKKYHSKGFDVLTVSEDRSVNDWKNGVYTDEIEIWNHIYDDYNRISSMYGVKGLPHMTLIDSNGKVITNKISLKNLEKELAKIFDK